MFYPPPSVADVSSLFILGCPSHYRRSFFGSVIRHGLSTSTFLRPLAPRALPRFFATMDALTPAGRFFGPCGHERRLFPAGLPASLAHTSNPSVPNHPTAPAPAFCSAHALALLGTASHWTLPLIGGRGTAPTGVLAWASLRTRRLAGRCGRIGFTLFHVYVTLLRTGCSPPAALHPVLPRRSSLRFQAGERSA